MNNGLKIGMKSGNKWCSIIRDFWFILQKAFSGNGKGFRDLLIYGVWFIAKAVKSAFQMVKMIVTI